MTIRIDVPGIGQIVAENAATESTLRELVRVLGGRSTASAGRSSDQSNGIVSSFVRFGGRLVDTTKALSMQTVQLTERFSSLENSVAGAASALTPFLNKIPIVGDVLAAAFTATARAAEGLADSFQKSTSVGADFGSSVNAMARSASQAGMTIDQFTGLLANAGPSLLAFGNNTTTGAKRFAQLSQELRATGEDLYALGFSTQDINEGLAAYGNLLRITGRNEKRSNEDLIKGSKQYLKEMDLLARITGESRKEKEKEREQIMTDIKFQAFARTLSEDSQKELLALIQSYPKEMQHYIKDVVMSGTTTLESTQGMAHGLGNLTNELIGMRQQFLNDQRVTAQQIQRSREIAEADADATIKNNREAIIGNQEYAASMQPITSLLGIQKNALEGALDAQANATANTDGFNEQVRKAQEQVSGISNRFKEALANSGLLPKLMDFFGFMSDILIRYVIPAFSDYLVPAIMTVSDFLIDLLVPAVEVIEDVFRDIAAPIQKFFDKIFVGTGIFDKMSNAFKIAGDLFVGTIEFLGTLFGNLTEKILDFASYIGNMISETSFFTEGMKMAGNAIDDFVSFAKTILSKEGADLVTQAIADFFTVILPSIGRDIQDYFENMLLDLEIILYEWGGRLFGKGISREEAEKIKADRKKAADERKFDRAVVEMNLKNDYDRIKYDKEQLESEKKQQKTSKKLFDNSSKMARDTLTNTAKAISMNTTSSAGAIETLKQFAEQQGKTSSFKNADAAKESIGEAAKAAVKENKSVSPEQTTPSVPTSGSGKILQTNNQSSPAGTSDQLNTLMSELVALMRQNNMQNRSLMSGISALTGNLFDNVG